MTLRFISYGGGVQSTALVVLAALRDPRLEAAMGGPVDAAVMANVGDDSEQPATLKFVRETVIPWAAEHNFPIHELDRVRRDGTTETLYGRLTREGSLSPPIPVRMSNGAPGTRSCTVDFKVKVIAKWAKANGATADDPAQGSIEGVRPIQRWANDSAGTASTIVLDTTGVMAPYLAVRTLEGEMRCGPGDWIIRGVQGEFYPCNPDIFDATYEPAGGV